MRSGIIVGFVSGIIIGLVALYFIFKATKTDGSVKCKFDERQKIARGEAYKISFWTLVVYNTIYGVYTLLVDKCLFDPMCAMVIGICIAAAVQVVNCIWHDAYFSLNEDKKRVFIALGTVGIINIIIGFINVFNGLCFTDGVINFRILNLVAGLLFIVIVIAYFARHMQSRKEME